MISYVAVTNGRRTTQMCYKKATCSFNDLPQIMGWMVQSGNGSQLPCLVYKLSLAASLYNMHEEWSGRIFQHCGINVQQLETRVLTDIRACACSWRRIKKTAINLAHCSTWNIPAKVFDRT